MLFPYREGDIVTIKDGDFDGMKWIVKEIDSFGKIFWQYILKFYEEIILNDFEQSFQTISNLKVFLEYFIIFICVEKIIFSESLYKVTDY